MILLLCFAAVLLLSVMLSSLAHRTILSTAVVFLVAGFVLGEGVTDVLVFTAEDPLILGFMNVALFAVLFSDGMKVGWRDVKDAMNLPGRALVLGMPLTAVVTAVAAHYIAGLPWLAAILVGAILSPTDPVFAGALVGNEKVPQRLRHLLNVESGVNDGLALPFVLIFLSLVEGHGMHLTHIATELGLGILIGVAVPYLALKLEHVRFFEASTAYQPLNAMAIGLLVFGLASVTHANLYLAAFAAGITVATFGEKEKHAFEEFGELLAEMAKLAAILVFGAIISPTMLAAVPVSGWVFAGFALLAARPIALAVSFLGAKLTAREQITAAWFGPKGFASVVYGLMVLESGVPIAEEVFTLVAATIVVSILAHSSTDVPVAKWFDEEHEVPAWFGPVRGVRANRLLSRPRADRTG